MTYPNMRIVKITNPDTGATGKTTQYSFEKIWGPQGWVLADDAQPAPQKAVRSPQKASKAPVKRKTTTSGDLPAVDDGTDTKAGSKATASATKKKEEDQ